MRIAAVGLGLIGGSFAKAAARAGHTVLAWNRTRATAEAAVAEGVAAAVLEEDMTSAAGAPEVYLISLPPRRVTAWIEAHKAHFADGAVVVDATGVKTGICKELEHYAVDSGCRWTFVGGHPMAGKEVAGWENSTADLWKGASMILTPYPSCGRGPLDMLEKLFLEMGFGRVTFTTPEHHDRMIALTSQLAHVVSSAYIQDPHAVEHHGYSAGSFRDMTRVALLDADIWTDLFMANREALAETLDVLIGKLGEYREAIAGGDAERLRGLLAAGRAARIAAATETPK